MVFIQQKMQLHGSLRGKTSSEQGQVRCEAATVVIAAEVLFSRMTNDFHLVSNFSLGGPSALEPCLGSINKDTPPTSSGFRVDGLSVTSKLRVPLGGSHCEHGNEPGLPESRVRNQCRKHWGLRP